MVHIHSLTPKTCRMLTSATIQAAEKMNTVIDMQLLLL